MAFWSAITDKLSSVGLVLRTRVARLTAYVAGMELVLFVLERIFRWFGAPAAAQSLHGWTRFCGYLLAALLIFLALRWFRNHVMWSVRNRLIVTYLFIGVVPIAFVASIALLSVYFLAGQFSSYLTAAEIKAQLQRLQVANAATAASIARHPASPVRTEDEFFPGRTVDVTPASAQPSWLQDGFNAVVVDHDKLYLRVVNFTDAGSKQLAVVSSVPLDERLLSQIASDVGPLRIFPVRGKLKSEGAANVTVNIAEDEITVDGKRVVGISAGTLPPARNRWDKKFAYFSQMPAADWIDGPNREDEIFLFGNMRPSGLYSRLSTASSGWADRLVILLDVFGVVLALIILVAWLIGIRLTRTVTYSVANLYKATQYINQGDFTHRIKVRENDQLSALQRSFNSMTDSLQKLIAEQKEKERLQSELEIAHEVQSQLFPQDMHGTGTLELHGVCRPARIVSGDYYDFLAYSPEQVGIAVGDISGKGISAALLMATIHSAVRAYEQEQLTPMTAMSSAYGTDMRIATVTPRVARPSPAQMLWLLNRHLYQSTQPEKYATLFLGFYEDETGCLTYSNAGHLPPIIISQDGTQRRLETGGTVVGLFDDRGYEEETVELYPGDIFIAFSDGMTEPENEFGEYGEERLVETIAAHRHLPLERISELAIAAVQDWIGSTEQPDDVTLVLARRTP